MIAAHIAEAQPVRYLQIAQHEDLNMRFAFQPLVDVSAGRIVAFEALLRGVAGQSAHAILDSVGNSNQAEFDQACRNRAIRDAAELGITRDLHLNCSHVTADNLADVLWETSRALDQHGVASQRVVLELTHLNNLGSPRDVARVRDRAATHGLRILADNYGSGEAGLKRLAVLRPHMVKLDREIVGQVHLSPRRQAIVLGLVATCRALGCQVIASRVEQAEEFHWLRDAAGIQLFQGYYFARPQTEPEATPRLS